MMIPRNREVWDVNWRDTGTNSNLVAPNESESNFNVRFLYGTRSRKRGFGFIA